MILFISKLVVTIAVVAALSIIAERGSPRLAGILSGFPTGSAITLTFIGIEMGPNFAANSALHNIAGMPAMLCLLLTYSLLSGHVKRGGLLAAPLGSVIVFGASAVMIHALNLPEWANLPIAVGMIVLFQFLFRRIPQAGAVRRVQLGPGVLLFRALVSALVVLAITGAARVVDAAWTGLFTSFPVTVFPLLIILQRTYGPRPGQGVIKNIPGGLWSLLAYTVAVSLLFPRLGVVWGALVALAAAVGVILVCIYAGRLWHRVQSSAALFKT